MRQSAQQKRERILAAAAAIFAADGFSGARVDVIAAAAGVNKRMLYHYVGGKAALFQAVLEFEAQRLNADSLTDSAIWRLVLQEAALDGQTRLLAALAVRVSATVLSESATVLTLRARLAEAMFAALLPGFAIQLPELSGPPARSERGRTGKPRIRMQPRLVASQAAERSDSKRSK